MATKGREIHDLPEKIRVIAETLYRIGEVDRPSRAALKAVFGEPAYNRLKKTWGSGRLSGDLEKLIAEKVGFSIRDPSWVDEAVPPTDRAKRVPDLTYAGRDTVRLFREMLDALIVGPADKIPSLLISEERTVLLNEELIRFSVEGTGQGSLPSMGAQLFFSINASAGHRNGFAYGFRRVRLRLSFDSASSARAENRLGHETKVEINDAILEAGGSRQHPEWYIHVPKGILLGDYNTTASPFCTVEEFRLGEQFSAELSIQLIDGSLSTVNGNPLPRFQKQRVIELLTAKHLFGERTSTWISLGQQILRVVPAG